MSLDFHVNQTAEVFDLAIDRLENAIRELQRMKGFMIERQDLTYAAEAITVIVNLPQSCRTDLFATRPLRALSNREN